MYQKPDFRLETSVRISWLEVECNLSNYVVEVPWKRELDPVAPHRCDISSLSADGAAARLGRLGPRLRTRFGIGCTTLWCGLRYTRRRPRGRLLRGLRLGKRHFLER